MSPLLPFIVITSIWLPSTAAQVCKRKNIGQPDNNINRPGCGKGAGWAAVKPENTFKRHNFVSNTDTYGLNWASLVRWPECVNKLQLWNNNGWQEVNKQNPMIYQVTMPMCNQGEAFQIKLRIFFPGITFIDKGKCIEVNVGWFLHKIQTLTDFLSINKYPESEQSGENVKIFWLRNKVKSTKCLDRVELTTGGDNATKLSINPSGGKPFFLLPLKCKAQAVTVTYYFKASFPDHTSILAVPKLESSCKATKEQENTTKLPNAIEAKYTNSTISDKNKEIKDLKTIIIIVSSVAIVSTLSLVLLVAICRDQKKKKARSTRTPGQMDMQGHGHLNDLYGTYYNGEPEYSTVEDTNAYYGVGDD